MNELKNLFSEFDATTKKEWLQRIEKDLKGRPIDTLDWSVGSLTLKPFFHADDFEIDLLEPIILKNNTNTWEIVEKITINTNGFTKANKQALSALMGGANSLHFVFQDFPTKEQLSALLQDIELDYISIYFSEPTQNKNPLLFLKNFIELAKQKGKNLEILRGGIHFNPFADGRYEVKRTIELIAWIKENLPNFKSITVDGGLFFKGSENVVEELAQTLTSAENYLKKLIDNNLNPETIAKKMQFNFIIGISYFIEIAKLRAFKLLWANVLTAYQISLLDFTTIHASVIANSEISDSNIHKISATTQAMSAVLGGVNSLTIVPDTNGSENEDFNRRIARNVQHLLQMESYLDRVADPAAGSYFIENLTTQISEASWARFQELTV